jgi:cytochrome c biogenesis protein CcmG, thiol:disulfide interchange protein DsbE
MSFGEWTVRNPHILLLRVSVIIGALWLVNQGLDQFQGARKPFQATNEDFSFPAVPGLKTAAGADVPGVKRDDLTKGVTVLSVFGTWCPPCLREHPTLVDLADRGVRVVGIATRDNEAMVRGWLKEAGNPYQAVGLDPTKHAWGVLGLRGIPTTLIFDADGHEIKRITGELTPAMVADLVLPAVAGAEQAKLEAR